MDRLALIAREIVAAFPSATTMLRPSEDLQQSDDAIDVDVAEARFSLQVGPGYVNLLEYPEENSERSILHGHFTTPREALDALVPIVAYLEADRDRPGLSQTLATPNLASATSRNTPAKVLVSLAVTGGQLTRMALGNNGGTPPDVLDILSRDSLETVRQAVAGNPATPAETLERLGGDDSPHVRQYVAGNPAVPPETLARLVEQETRTSIRWALGANPATPRDALARLVDYGREPEGAIARKALETVRAAVAGNPAADKAILQTLSVSDAAPVRMAAETTLDLRQGNQSSGPFRRMGVGDRKPVAKPRKPDRRMGM